MNTTSPISRRRIRRIFIGVTVTIPVAYGSIVASSISMTGMSSLIG